MSAKSETTAVPVTLLNSPLMTFFTLIAAIVIGSSLLEFNELLFPPKVTSIRFWALMPVYVVALDAWFGVVSWSRNIPYTDKPILRTMVLFLVVTWIILLALMYFASMAHISLLSYLWGLVILFVMVQLICVIRSRIIKSPEPYRIYTSCGVLSLVVAIAYSIWLFVYSPVPDVMNWVFTAIAFIILVGMRVWMKVAHIWRPEEKRAGSGQ
ncbi:MAG TPA: hypothetical protein G4O20_04615 [Dehalococcoidia bacterium]|nr:hypothetical protein [Dehalococcoidia bacterium]